jgi:hypothetical protein
MGKEISSNSHTTGEVRDNTRGRSLHCSALAKKNRTLPRLSLEFRTCPRTQNTEQKNAEDDSSFIANHPLYPESRLVCAVHKRAHPIPIHKSIKRSPIQVKVRSVRPVRKFVKALTPRPTSNSNLSEERKKKKNLEERRRNATSPSHCKFKAQRMQYHPSKK